MMMSKDSFLSELKGASYYDLIKERDELIEFIQHYEAKEMANDRTGEEWECKPGPDVIYQVYLEYLSGLCLFMKEKYNHDYVWGDKKL